MSAHGAAPSAPPRRARSLWPSTALVTTKLLELRRRHGLMTVVVLLIVGLPVLVLGIRLLFHALDPASYGPAGTPVVFAVLCNTMAEFGFIVAAALGTTAGTTDLTEGVFRHLVVTGRSRVALYLARIPAGLAIVLPLVAVAFSFLCLVTAYAGTAEPSAVSVSGVSVPTGLSESGLESWLVGHLKEAGVALGPSAPPRPTAARRFVEANIGRIDALYVAAAPAEVNPAPNEMAKIGLWIELEVSIGLLVGLGLGSLIGQRTIATILMIALEIIVTPILANTEIPYFLDGQRLIVGVAMDQLRPAGLAASLSGHGGGRVLFGGRGELGIPPMPTWAMVTVICSWIVGWSVIGAWRMATRDA